MFSNQSLSLIGLCEDALYPIVRLPWGVETSFTKGRLDQLHDFLVRGTRLLEAAQNIWKIVLVLGTRRRRYY